MGEISGAPPVRSRRWTVLASGLLCGLLGLVVIYTRPSAFYSPIAVMIVAAIGLTAVLLQLRFYNREQLKPMRAPLWLNIVGIVLAVLALFPNVLHLHAAVAEMMPMGAIGAFSISSAVVLDGFRKRRKQEAEKEEVRR